MPSIFIEVHAIHTLPPSNANRGQDGSPKSITYGGSLRPRLSSQSQKRAGRIHYRTNGIDRDHLAERSRNWDQALAENLTIGTDETRLYIARIILAIFNTGADKVLGQAVNGLDTLTFFGHSEIVLLAELASEHSEILEDLGDRALQLKTLLDEGGKSKEFKNHPKPSQTAKLTKAIVGRLHQQIPGEVALFGRMMATLTKLSVDGSVQVADALAVNSTNRSRTSDGWKTGEIDFFAAVDDIIPDQGSGMIGERTVVSPVFYRYFNVNLTHLAELIGDLETAKSFAIAFLKGMLMSLPTGNITSHAHMTLPDFVVVQTFNHQPFNHAPAFQNGIEGQNGAGDSIAKQASNRLVSRINSMNSLYSLEPLYCSMLGVPDIIPESPTLDEVLNGAIAVV